MRYLIGLIAIVVSVSAHGVPATINITPTALSDDGTGGVATSYRLHRGCDLAAQTVGPVLADPATVGQAYPFSGDTDSTYQVCAVAVNSAGVGGFANVVSVSFSNVVIPPGDSTIVLSCNVDPASGVIADCVQTNNP